MISSLETRSPGRWTRTPRTSSAREPNRDITPLVITPREAAAVEAKALEQEHVGCDERVHPAASRARADHKGPSFSTAAILGHFKKIQKI
jgi:hypothetical protein